MIVYAKDNIVAQCGFSLGPPEVKKRRRIVLPEENKKEKCLNYQTLTMAERLGMQLQVMDDPSYSGKLYVEYYDNRGHHNDTYVKLIK